jgi:hypothetical protein
LHLRIFESLILLILLLAFSVEMHYNLFGMALPSQGMLLLLFLSALGMALIAAFYLRRRSLSLPQYLAWGMLLIFIPFLGPFLVILLRPGRPA